MSMSKRDNQGKNAPLAQRMRRLRILIEGDETGAPKRFAERLGITYTRWNNVENGFPLSNDVATRIVQQFPAITYDWLFKGNVSGLSIVMAEQLSEMPDTASQITEGE